MKIWKLIPLLLVIFTVSSCSSTSTDDSTEANTPTASSPASSPEATTAAPKADKAAAPVEKIETVTIPAGSELIVTISSSLNSGSNKAGDEFEGGLALPLNVNGKTILEKGTKVIGKVVDAAGSARVKGLASIRLELTSVVHNGKTVSIVTNPFVEEAEATKGRDAAVVGGGAGLGAAIGAIAGGKKGAATGAIIGGAAGGGTVLATKGKEVDFPAESKITFTLADALTVRR